MQAICIHNIPPSPIWKDLIVRLLVRRRSLANVQSLAGRSKVIDHCIVAIDRNTVVLRLLSLTLLRRMLLTKSVVRCLIVCSLDSLITVHRWILDSCWTLRLLDHSPLCSVDRQCNPLSHYHCVALLAPHFSHPWRKIIALFSFFTFESFFPTLPGRGKVSVIKTCCCCRRT